MLGWQIMVLLLLRMICGAVTFSNNLITSPSGCSGTGCYTYSFAAQDGCGNNVSLGTADFCIEDTTSPTINGSGDGFKRKL